MRRLPVLVAGLACLAVAAGCGSDGDDADSTLPSSPETSTSDATATTSPTVTKATTALATVPTTQPTTDPATSTTVAAPSTSAAPVDSTTNTTTQPPSASTGTAAVYASDGGPYPWLPVGWWDGSQWVSVDWRDGSEVAVPQSSYDALSVASLELADGPLHNVSDYTLALWECVDQGELESFEVDLGLPEPDQWWGYRAVGVLGDWNVQPRPVSLVGLDDPVYQALGESLVPTDRPVDPSLGDVSQVIRADLDGDGIEEVLFTFEHLGPDSQSLPAAGEFSLVIARYPDATGAVVDEVLFEHVVSTDANFPDMARARLAAVADLNGDGTMEVAVAAVYWEAADIAVYEFRDGALQEVMRSGCGV